MGVVLVCTNLRLILENFMKYGWLFNPARWIEVITFSGKHKVQAGVLQLPSSSPSAYVAQRDWAVHGLPVRLQQTCPHDFEHVIANEDAEALVIGGLQHLVRCQAHFSFSEECTPADNNQVT